MYISHSYSSCGYGLLCSYCTYMYMVMIKTLCNGNVRHTNDDVITVFLMTSSHLVLRMEVGIPSCLCFCIYIYMYMQCTCRKKTWPMRLIYTYIHVSTCVHKHNVLHCSITFSAIIPVRVFCLYMYERTLLGQLHYMLYDFI